LLTLSGAGLLAVSKPGNAIASQFSSQPHDDSMSQQ